MKTDSNKNEKKTTGEAQYFQVLIKPEIKEIIRKMADAENKTMTDIIEDLINEEFDRQMNKINVAFEIEISPDGTNKVISITSASNGEKIDVSDKGISI